MRFRSMTRETTASACRGSQVITSSSRPRPIGYKSVRARLAATGLTSRQIDVALRVLAGLSNKRIANELDLTEQTVKDHLYVIFRKLGIHRRAELAGRVLPLRLRRSGNPTSDTRRLH